MKNTILLGVDTGFAHLGLAALCIAPDGVSMRVDDFCVVNTEKSHKKLNLLATEDNVQRANTLSAAFDAFLTRHHNATNVVVAVCVESMSWPRNAATTAKMGIGWGVVLNAVWHRKLPMVQSSPQQIKKHLCDRRDASKLEIQNALLALVPRANPTKLGHARLEDVAARINQGQREHPYDALAAAVVGHKSTAVQAALRVA